MLLGSILSAAMTTNWAVSIIKDQNLQAIIFYADFQATVARESFDNL